MTTPKDHIEEIRRKKFSIGGEANPLMEEFHLTVKMLSAELYAKDVHFLMELIQNAEDNEYPEGVDPSLECVITSRDITGTGAAATLMMFNNEKGFSASNINSICSVAKSTKKGNRKRGYIGEKGIGFKSVFLITSRPYIFSNGFQIRFNEEPCPHCNLGYVVPEWVEDNPTLSDIREIYGSGSTLPTTTLILPLKADKVNAVKQQLSSVQPEVLLFLSKIKRLSVREHNEDPNLNTVSAIAITSETNFLKRKNIDAESFTLHLAAEGDKLDDECSYYMWKQKFPVKQENKVERRMDVEEWVITLAFPYGQRLQRGTTSPGIYAFLPTEMVTNFPFIIQADFLLSSSRETILFDDKWNQGILSCVPCAFVNALSSLVKLTEDAPVSSLPPMFSFLPVNSSAYQQLNAVRESIRAILVEENIIPSESYMKQKFFHKPREVGRLMPAFWDILNKAKDEGVSLKNLSNHGVHVLSYAFDRQEYDQVLNFLGVGPVDNEWYARCIQGSNLIMGVSENLYLELLLFIAERSSNFSWTNIQKIPLLKYVDLDGNVALCSIKDNNQNLVCISRQHSWLTNWNREFRGVANHFFMPKSTQKAIQSFWKKEVLWDWMKVRVKVVNVYEYADVICGKLNGNRKLIVAYAHFLYHSHSKKYLSEDEVASLCSKMPLIDNYGQCSTGGNKILVPANGSKWVELIGSDPWRLEGYIELGEDYLHPGNFAGETTTGEQLLEFLRSHGKASDIPDITPPNARIPVSAQLTKQNTFLLLDWIKALKGRGIAIPEKFLTSIKEGSWLTVTMNGSSGCRPPVQSFVLTSSLGKILQNGSVLVDVPLVDVSFYGDSLLKYMEELKTIGVMFEYREACEFIGKRLMSLAASSNITKGTSFSILNFIKFLREEQLPADSFIRVIREGRWLKTSQGDRSPAGSALYCEQWKVASQISNIPFVDQKYYGDEIINFKTELQLLGVSVGFNQNYKLVADHLKISSSLCPLTAEATLLVLECMYHHSRSVDKFVNALKCLKCLKTNSGFKSPDESYLLDPASSWSSILQVFNGIPILDLNFYGRAILHRKSELKQLGVLVDFEDAVKAFAGLFKRRSSTSSISKDNVLSFLSCYRQLMKLPYKIPSDLKKCIHEEKWLWTRLGCYRSPSECILFGPEWKSIDPITVLPFIDDSDHHYGAAIHEYENELKSMGVVIKLEEGVKFVVDSLCFPWNPSKITRANALSLLKCIRIFQEKSNTFPQSFCRKVSEKWMRTNAGYRSPGQCLLFDSEWEQYLKPTDGPFIDETFYGSEMKKFKKELTAIGVAVEVKNGCSLLASHIDFHSDLDTITRIYNFLAEFKWKAGAEAGRRIWIPDGSENGQWVNPEECVLHDEEGFFSSQFYVLDKHYDGKLLEFFSSAFRIKFEPTVDDFCKLWKDWGSSEFKLSNEECCAFWGCVLKHWSSKTESLLADKSVKLPVDSGSGEILLFDRRDVFIADDLQLKDAFDQSSCHSIFVWYPQLSLPSLPRTKLLEIFSKIGVRTISEAVQKQELSLEGVPLFKQVKRRDVYINQPLAKLILGFLGNPTLNMEAAKRYEAVKSLLNLSVKETEDPIEESYSLSFSSGEIVNARVSQMIRWDRESSTLFTQRLSGSLGHTSLLEYAIHFSEVISKGVLWEMEDHINALAELIRLAFLLEFNEEAVKFLMTFKNLQIFMEDEEFLSAAFSSE